MWSIKTLWRKGGFPGWWYEELSEILAPERYLLNWFKKKKTTGHATLNILDLV